ncbi:MAG: serine/threonine-protein kinase, partial [Myxococcota bacterium]
MAEVFLAKSFGAHGFEKPVAIKRILSRFAKDQQFVTMLIDEAKICSLLNHPNIVPVMDFSADQDSCYLVMEYVPGRSLSNLQRNLGAQDRSISVEHLIYVVKEVAAGLHHAHVKTDRNGRPLHIVHRDVSPQNILLSFDGFVKVIDFGIARARDRLARTEAGTIKGKIRYLAPEQVEGRDVDGRTDLFALGIVLWEALTERVLFDGDNDVQVIDRIVEAKVPDPREFNSEVPEELSRAVLRALAKEKQDRFPSCDAFSAELRGILARLNPDYDPASLGALMRTQFGEEMDEDAREEAEAEAALERELNPPTDENAIPPLEPGRLEPTQHGRPREKERMPATVVARTPEPAPLPAPSPRPRREGA